MASSHLSSSLENDYYNIRKAVETDVPVIFKFITEMSDALKNPGTVQIDENELLRNGFGDHKIYHCLVIEHVTSAKTIAIGFGLYYFTFPTWSGKQLYLEDIFVMPDHRNKGLGTLMMKEICKAAAAEGCRQMKWQVMDWDNDAIRLYERWGAYRSGQHWLTYCFNQETILKHAASIKD